MKNGSEAITDRLLTLQYIHNLYYWVGNIGSLSWFATTYIEHYCSFTVAYTVTFVSVCITCGLLFLARSLFVKHPPTGNVLPKATHVLVCAARSGFRMRNAEPIHQQERRGRPVPWTAAFVQELSLGLLACRVLIAFVVFYVCFDQMQNNLISQAKQMQTHGIPNDLLPALNQVACIVIGPIIQHGLYAWLNNRNIRFGAIARITVGFVFIALSMVYATITQHLIYNSAPCYNSPGKCHAINGVQQPNDVNVWVQSPIYILMAIGEIFALVTGLELADQKSPKDMRAIVQAINMGIAGLGSACAMGLTAIAYDPNLVILYACLSAGMALTTLCFWYFFHKYDNL